MVLEVQKWLNKNYGDHPGSSKIPENGRTGWTTIYALTRALQIELGITDTANAFGPATQNAYKEFGKIAFENVPNTEQGENIVQILQGACWCKGYNPQTFDGIFTPQLERAVITLQYDAGLPKQDGVVYTHVFQAFLTMDAYVLTTDGDNQVREIQRELNNNYYQHSGVNPCDGHYQRQTNQALVYALQTEIGIPASQQTGAVGPATREGLPSLGQGSDQSNFIKLLKYAVIFNGYSLSNISGEFNSELSNALKNFQEFTLLDQNGNSDFQTWMSLLVSTGDPDRKGTASDGVTEVTTAKAQTLADEGYVIIGRYLTNVPGGLNKKIQPGELQTIFDAGLAVYPIFQESHSSARDFSYNTGYQDYQEAFKAAAEYGFPEGTTIYFAVDFDVLGHEVSNYIIPHWTGMNAAKEATGNQYNIGIYGPRNACIQVSERELADYSFISGLSTGFSGNLGYPLPDNWAFDQISTVTIGSGTGEINIDNSINSGRDEGASFTDDSVEVPEQLPEDENKDFFKQVSIVADAAKNYNSSLGNTSASDINYDFCSYYRRGIYDEGNWSTIIGDVNDGFLNYLEQNNVDEEVGTVKDYIDLIESHEIGSHHLFAAISGHWHFGSSVLEVETIRDLTSWMGDLITVLHDVYLYQDEFKGTEDERAYQAAHKAIGGIEGEDFPELTFDLNDLLGDMDAYYIGTEARINERNVGEVTTSYYNSNEPYKRFTNFFNGRFNGDESSLRDAAHSVLTGGLLYGEIRDRILENSEEGNGKETSDIQRKATADAFTDVIISYVNKEK